jgi:zinc transport system ATP-binding protein
MNTPAIDIRGLTFSYGGPPVLEGIDLTIEERSFVSIIGPNGGGKTTLLKLMLGLLRPSAGIVRVFGRRPQEVRRQIGYMPQTTLFDPHFPISTLDVVLMGRLGTGIRDLWRSRQDRQVAEAALDEVGLLPERRRPFSKLSGGQRQRALIARALACQPRILMLDEPTANLDQLVGNLLYDLLRRLRERLTIVAVSHDLGFVSHFVDRVVCVNRTASIHPAHDLTSDVIAEMYGGEMHIVRHDVHGHGGGAA